MNTEPKKRGRKKGSTNSNTSTEPTIPKKRGRKPKGGKIIEDSNIKENDNEIVSNVILHLKCSKNDIDNDNDSNST